MFLELHISILESSIDRVTLKTGVMMLKILLYHDRSKLHFNISYK